MVALITKKILIMKYIYIILIFILNSCSVKMITNTIELKDQIILSLILNNDNSVELIFKNNSKNELKLSDPKCYINSLIQITGVDGKIDQILKIKPDISCAEKMITLLAGQERSFLFSYRLTKLFELNEGKEYEISLKYVGGIINSEGIALKGLVNCERTFMIK